MHLASPTTTLDTPDPPRDQALPLAVVQEIDRRCEQFEQVLRSGTTAKIENHLDGVVGPERAALLRELLALEFEYRAGRGELPSREEYLARFAEHAGIVELVLAELDAGGGRDSIRGDPLPADAIPTFLLNHPRYHVERFLGRGGMGAVFLARHRALERPVALKIIRPELLADPAVVERFRCEVKAAASLSDPHIVAVYDAETTGNQHFLVMEYIAGTDLARLVLDGGPLPLATACDYICQAAIGLQKACERGLVHRDITPRNLMLTGQGQIKILDFGLAQFLGVPLSAGQQAERGSLLGSVDYMAPEQAANPQAADIRADIYSLGCTLYFLLTGQPPFPGGSLLERLGRHSLQAPPRLDRQRADIPADFAGVLDRMLAKDPAARYQTPHEVIAALTPFAVASQAAVNTPRSRRRRATLLAALLLCGSVAAGWSLRIWPLRSASVPQMPAQVEAERLYREGLHLLAQRKESQVRLAIRRFETALNLNPRFPLAQTALADAFNLCGDYGWDMADAVFPQAKQAARRAIEQDRKLAEAHLALAFVLHEYDCDRSSAQSEYLAALDLNPRLAEAHHWYAWFLVEAGHFAESDQQIALARQLAPDDPIIVSNVGRLHYLAGNYAQAVKDLQFALELEPDFRKAHRDLGLVYAELGNLDEAIRQLDQSRGLTDDSRDTIAAQAYAYARNRQPQKARELLTQLEPAAESKPVAYEIVTIYSALGEKAQALDWLDRAFREHSADRGNLAVDPRLDAVRDEPRFQELLRAAGLGAK